MKKVIIICLAILNISCTINLKNADIPVFNYSESEFRWSSPTDIEFNLKPNPQGDRWIIERGLFETEINAGANLETILSVLFPEADAFKYGKVLQDRSLTALSANISFKESTTMSIRALKIGTHKGISQSDNRFD